MFFVVALRELFLKCGLDLSVEVCSQKPATCFVDVTADCRGSVFLVLLILKSIIMILFPAMSVHRILTRH